jgi:ATP adenylyltransferase
VDSLFAPWRLEVIEKYQSTTSCILCGLLEKNRDAENLILERSSHSYLVMNKYPYSNGHLMIVPKRHVGEWEALEAAELSDMMALSQRAMRVLRSELQCKGFNMGANLGSVAGAGIPDHVHLHLVPRWPGDFNFMPVLGETKVISEHLVKTYEKLQTAWEKDQ